MAVFDTHYNPGERLHCGSTNGSLKDAAGLLERMMTDPAVKIYIIPGYAGYSNLKADELRVLITDEQSKPRQPFYACIHNTDNTIKTTNVCGDVVEQRPLSDVSLRRNIGIAAVALRHAGVTIDDEFLSRNGISIFHENGASNDGYGTCITANPNGTANHTQPSRLVIQVLGRETTSAASFTHVLL